ncbi:MAG: PAS domain S-box protein [Spirochaetales bacterium]|nr:PAS domain S-box protein [Spirochaetales bacterium]
MIFFFVFILIIIILLSGSLYKLLSTRRNFTLEIRSVSDFFKFIPIWSFILSILIVVGGWILMVYSLNTQERIIVEQNSASLKAIENALSGEILNIDHASRALSGSPRIHDFLLTRNQAYYDEVNAVLDRYKEAMEVSVCYLLDSSGTTVATSNRNEADSFLNKNYAFREYFQNTQRGQAGYLFALGITSGQRGYYASFPVFDGGIFLGACVLKKEIDALERYFYISSKVFFVHASGVIFLSNAPEWIYHPLWPIDQQSVDKINASNLFGQVRSQPVLQTVPAPGDYFYYEGNLTRLNTQGFIKEDWELYCFVDLATLQAIYIMSLINVLALIFIFIVSGFLISYFRYQFLLKSLHRSEERFQQIFEQVLDILIIMDENMMILEVNPNTRRLLKFSDEELKMLNIMQLVKFKENDNHANTHHDLNNIEIFYTKDKQPLYVMVSTAPIKFKNQSAILLYAHNVSELKQAELALVESEALHREMLDTLPQIIYEADAEGNILFTNKFGIKAFGYSDEDLERKIHFMNFISPEDVERATENLAMLFRNELPGPREYRLVRKDGGQFIGLIHSNPIIKNNKVVCVRGFIIDISEQKIREVAKHRINKLDSLGILAGGLAHDFNNILTILQNGLALVKINDPDNQENISLLGDLEIAIDRGKDITHQLLTFSKGGAPLKQLTNIKQLISETSAFVLSGSPVKVTLNIEENLWIANVDRGQISQVIQNLMINALQAMDNKGDIFINGLNIQLDSLSSLPLPPGKYLRLQIRDTGKGIDEKIQPYIFDPFFTTRSNGNGLGLSTVHSIVMRHKGYITLDSSPHGACFTIYLPAEDSSLETESKKSRDGYCESMRLLIMDDELTILHILKRILEQRGFVVYTAESGEKAIELYKKAKENNNSFDVIIMDLTIPGGLGGEEVIKIIKQIDPKVKAIVSSGYSHSKIMSDYRQYGFDDVIAKPYSFDQLMQKILLLCEED